MRSMLLYAYIHDVKVDIIEANWFSIINRHCVSSQEFDEISYVPLTHSHSHVKLTSLASVCYGQNSQKIYGHKLIL